MTTYRADANRTQRSRNVNTAESNPFRESSYRVYCAPCEEYKEFPPDGAAAILHANRHGCVICWTEANGRYIGAPAPENIPAPLATSDELLDLQDMPLDVWSAFARQTIAGEAL